LKAILFVAALLPCWASVAIAPAAAQTVHCKPTFGGRPDMGTTCQADSAIKAPAKDAPPAVYDWKSVKAAPCTAFDRVAGSGNYCDARQLAADRKRVGDMIASGDCDGALKAALGTGDLSYASEVKAFCAK
jgi:hypothetical protein